MKIKPTKVSKRERLVALLAAARAKVGTSVDRYAAERTCTADCRPCRWSELGARMLAK
jgi:hypothetical protein